VSAPDVTGVRRLAPLEAVRGRLGFARSGSGLVGLVLLALVLGIALFGPFFAPHSPTASLGIPYEGPTAGAPLGYDGLGRDVLSRVLWGGRSVLAIAGLATLIAYLAGGVVGLVAGYSRNWVDGLLMRGVDVLIAFPALLFLLVLITGAGTSKVVLVAGVAAVQGPLVARVVRTATLEQTVRGYVEAAEARGESVVAILRREVLPNILAPIAADAPLRLTYSIILVASVNFFGLGLQPPDADWALIISENRDGLSLNPWVIFVPAALIALLTISLSLVGDAVARGLGRSVVGR
jgi:ABC-type dipeptide/oligopeptide/nickel transport system permease subunit